MPKKKTHDEFASEVLEMHPGLKIRSRYVDAVTPMDFTCEYGHDFSMRPNNILGGQYCSECFKARRSASIRRGKIKDNYLWNTHPHIASRLKNPEDGYQYSIGSKETLEFICEYCGNIFPRQLHHIERRGLCCPFCSDGISFPNKLIYYVVSSTDAENIDAEWTPKWLYPYRYDLYFEYKGDRYVVEMDGGLGHGNRSYDNNCADVNGLQNDKIKDELAKQHGIIIIRINADYGNQDKYSFLRFHILQSQLSSIFSMNCVDWNECFKRASSSLVFKAAELYNYGLSAKEMVEALAYSHSSILKWLKQATELGLCRYNKVEMKMRGQKRVRVNQYSLDGVFMCTYEAIKEAAQNNNISTTGVRYGLFKENHVSCGYQWYIADDPTQPDKTKIIPNTKQSD